MKRGGGADSRQLVRDSELNHNNKISLFPASSASVVMGFMPTLRPAGMLPALDP
jgi:hypothetical protein